MSNVAAVEWAFAVAGCTMVACVRQGCAGKHLPAAVSAVGHTECSLGHHNDMLDRRFAALIPRLKK